MDSAGNIYRHKVDFTALALQDPAFKETLSAKGRLDFSNPDAVRQLTVSLLRRDFGLEVELPDDRLCPPVPNRLNYILWLQDLIDCTGDDYHEGFNADRDVVGLDIGTGSSCIYPLLGAVHRKRWTFVATDIDKKNLQYARQNVQRNNLQSRIQVVDSVPDGPLIPLDRIQLKMLDFTMCNPPFYESHEEMKQLAEEKQNEPLSVCTGAETEMITPGGEVAFVKKMIQESLHLREAVRWYTSMLGKRSSLLSLIDELQSLDNKNWAVTEFIQGDKTKRWAIAWSWKDIRPTMGVSRSVSNIPKKYLPFPSEFHFRLPCKSVDSLIEVIDTEINSFRIPWKWDNQRSSGLGFTMENAWSRQARRKRQQQQEAAQDGSDQADIPFDTENALFGFIIQVRRPGLENADVTVRWIKGVDSVIFESFCGMLKRKVEGR
ncbi:U6 small nuclear RNA (adenine-(43)-N(6))-methyltransferase [Trichophyton interdigitale]|uniref:U6 small nuclear RNA (adenine-(43)-N(6))-methyltransferase n=1 Tax=Trichophyton interdigitale TaxID=101480 RepID=A0A9P4YEE5_9EURO|nr:U6 small nuclear RNA (adenine-(43)-N(6))-methyltransferase [Trichophyton interdigitale]KAF3893175.1 U6 small nuclear RNA (adenine-(43)-N(6))-methyltransferase [Trichophyton interdigitale]KAG8212355.1 U6 small nuclear RNA (adenine-(43)-N(6))-methyltransferase [Trichophyton interdigitale]